MTRRSNTPILLAGLTTGLLIAQAHAQTLTVRNIALSGQQAPGTAAGVTFSSFDTYSINASGRVGIHAQLAGPGVTATNRYGLWWDVPGTLQLVARSTNPAPGQGTLNYVAFDGPNLSDSGVMTYTASIAPTAGGSRQSVWTVSSTNSPAAFAVGFTQAPSVEVGALWDFFNTPIIGATGNVAFRAGLGGPTPTSSHWVGTSSSLTLVARDGMATGLLPGVNFASVLNEYRTNSAGDFVFRTSLAGTGVTASNNQALWFRSAGGTLSLLARTGNQAPGLPAGVTYTSFVGDPELDSAGRAVIHAVIVGPGVTSDNNSVVYVYDNGTTSILAREGDQVPGLPANTFFSPSFNIVLGGQGTTALATSLTGSAVTASTNTAILKRTGAGAWTLFAREGVHAPGAAASVNFADFISNGVNISMNSAGRLMFAAVLSNNLDGLWMEDPAGALSAVVIEGTQFDVNDDPNTTTLKTVSALAYPPVAGNDDGRRSSFSDTGEALFRLTFTDSSSGLFAGGFPQGCDSIDFNADGLFPDTADIDDFLSVFSGGPCSTGTCGDIDFNNDGLLPDTLDIDSMLSVFSGGPCL